MGKVCPTGLGGGRMAGVWAEIEALWLNGAERKLVAACKAGVESGPRGRTRRVGCCGV